LNQYDSGRKIFTLEPLGGPICGTSAFFSGAGAASPCFNKREGEQKRQNVSQTTLT